MSKGLTAAETILAAWFMAITNRPVTQELIFHSDRGVQYACDDFTRILNGNELITRSMSNSPLTLSIFEWIESWYNRKRRHSSLGYKTIEEYQIIISNFNHAA
jgi:putative transposase